MKKVMNTPETMVLEMCRGLVLAHPSLELDSKYKIIKKKQLNPDKVTLISGGGSGHEPAHAGFVGQGMLDTAVCGDIFASPSQIQVYQAIRAAAGQKGTLLIIKNYSGDMMNFKNAAYLAGEDGIEVDYVKVDDDIAVEDSLYTVGNRGVAGTILVHKVTGAAAERGMSLPEVKAVAQKAIDRTRSIGFAFTSCTVPAKGTPTFQLAENEMEYGVGIHGEPGIRKKPVITADQLASRMVASLLESLGAAGDSTPEVVVLVNGFGATPLQELYVLNHAVIRELTAKGIQVYHGLVGNFMTSIDMAGASLTLMKVDDQLKELFADACSTPALSLQGPFEPVSYTEAAVEPNTSVAVSFKCESPAEWAAITGDKLSLHNVLYAVDKMSEIIIDHEVPFCELDAHAGDGDFGMSLAKGFKQLKAEWKEMLAHHASTIGSFLDACSLIIMEHCGGGSGPIWGSGFRAAGKYAGDKTELAMFELAEMMDAVVKGIQATGERAFGRGAVVGDKTLIDALVPYAEMWKSCAQAGDRFAAASSKAANAAIEGAKQTESIVARMGRAGAVGERSLGHPDAAAYALGVIFTELAEAMKG